MECGIAKQIAEHCEEPEQPECPRCFRAMTEVKKDFLECEECFYGEWI